MYSYSSRDIGENRRAGNLVAQRQETGGRILWDSVFSAGFADRYNRRIYPCDMYDGCYEGMVFLK